MPYTTDDAIAIARTMNISFDTFEPEDLRIGMNVELEHGTAAGKYNLTNDDTRQTTMIAMAHLMERGDYYRRLDAVEDGFTLTRHEMLMIAIFIIVIVVIILSIEHIRDPINIDDTRSTLEH